MQRVLILGCSGSGKSTLTRSLAERTGLPVIHLDQAYFGPNWKEPPEPVWRKRVARLAARDAWLMDGNFRGTFDLRMPRADTILFIDLPTRLCLWRVLKRTLRYYGRGRPGSASGCRERFDLPFLKYVGRYNERRRPLLLLELEAQRDFGKAVHILSSRRAVKQFLADL